MRILIWLGCIAGFKDATRKTVLNYLEIINRSKPKVEEFKLKEAMTKVEDKSFEVLKEAQGIFIRAISQVSGRLYTT